MKDSTRHRLTAGVFLGCTLLAACNAAVDAPLPAAAEGSRKEAARAPAAPEFQGLDTWFNSQPLSLEKLRGKVVLVDFWTFDCINCLNHMPYVKEWHSKYKNQGLVVVGIHTPEFAYEKPAGNVRKAIERLGIEHAVAQDNEYKTWKAFGNQYWPATYLIDKNGRIVYSHFGEGRYGETERRIQALLAEPAPAAGS
ncbi:thioredoxin family protein [Variovorax sp. HW608]|uniref:thioredoxin family protein n=1 Tax=Variovorax sp. HW608 TaxID=1034889 RepID=UPI000B5ABF8D|nr:thioredoxin family protein [Variovorax sp. HW608]